MFKKFFSVRIVLTIGLILSIAFATYSIHYKIKYWGFTTNPKQVTNLWTVEAHVSFQPTGDPIKVSFARPVSGNDFKVLDEDLVAPEYDIKKTKSRIVLTTKEAETGKQDLYYRALFYDVPATATPLMEKGKPAIKKIIPNEQESEITKQFMQEASELPGDWPQKIIGLLTQKQADAQQSFVKEYKTPKDKANLAVSLLAVQKIPARIVRGIQLVENKKTFAADILLEAYTNDAWEVYNIDTAEKGLPKNFIIYQRDGNSLIDVEGGTDSIMRFSVLKSVRSSFSLAGHRAKGEKSLSWFSFENSIYNLPLGQQNVLKWMMIYSLAILVVVVMRNVVGLKTMGTFTPMLISMALIQTGFWPGLICFVVIIGVGFIIRALLSRFNLLLVPRISAVVICVILTIQMFMVIGYKNNIEIASSALFFPIIIMAWIIERASITWEEDGPLNAARELFWTLVVAIITYAIVVNETIRHIMFAFNEINIVLLFVVMLLGTYTGYRWTELVRFAPIKKKRKKKHGLD
ncbi:MAG: inactive transglutaminase family protein [Lactobacillales bacterium]|jgi:hypothetical protein|nr:inactive transglutaminase family protein [Lactobacillales bacterium]